MGIVRDIQDQVGIWIDQQFLPGDTLERRGLVLGAESGEVQQAINKAQQNVQGGPIRWLPEVETEAGDAFIALCGIAHRAGFDLESVIAARWSIIRRRDYRGTGTSATP